MGPAVVLVPLVLLCVRHSGRCAVICRWHGRALMRGLVGFTCPWCHRLPTILLGAFA